MHLIDNYKDQDNNKHLQLMILQKQNFKSKSYLC